MSRKKHTHLRGERGQAFADRIRGVPAEQILCVSLDIHKYFHVVMMHNALGEIVTPLFEIDIFQAGFDQLHQAIETAVARTNARVVLVGMEPTGHYFENLARHLHHDQPSPRSVTLINSFAVSRNREQQMMQREKDDEVDAAAIGDLVRRGEGTPFQPITGLYLEMQHLARARLSKVKIQTALKNQILGHLDRIFPGLVIQDQAAKERYEPLFASNFWSCQTLQHLIRTCPNPRRLAAMTPHELRAAFHERGFALGLKTATNIITYAQKVLPPDPEIIAIRTQLLAHDLSFLEEVERLIALLEDRLHVLLQQTPYWVWTKVRGLSETQVASLAAAIGDPSHYTHAAQIFRRSGLVSGRNDSGTRRHKGKGKRVVKTGDVYLRRALMTAIMSLIRYQPTLQDYFNDLHRSKHAGVARVATARRAVGILWAMQRDQQSRTLVLKRGVEM